MLNKYSKDGDEGLTKAVDAFQNNFICCGIDIYTDWRSSYHYQMYGKFPETCCINGPQKDVCPTDFEVEWNKVYKPDVRFISTHYHIQ
jgi:hypothetical protein